ncbi:hypothetical protein SAM40697_5201 [Streptomyces ambofaciens]|uniref:Uncharacterized protein n=1 Tax=Streptomyces ambofaciens TaxID=1889 RepID=A0ABN4PG36_STRAM|nr:hypothetical protein [Streptomyces ambofaciens]ANB09157.1 hypothetical protein SAM40697_5201 [Streptomyces ambofaciens]
MPTEPATSPLQIPRSKWYSTFSTASVAARPADIGFSHFPAQGDLIYLLCRATGAPRAVEFATSLGVSLLHFAAAVRDNGGGTVTGSEIVPEKATTARCNLTDAGLASEALTCRCLHMFLVSHVSQDVAARRSSGWAASLVPRRVK